MRMTLRNILNLAVSAALVGSSVPAGAVQVQINQDIHFRQLRAGHQVLGVLKAGSIVDVAVSNDERQNHTDPNTGNLAFDLHKTLQYMLSNQRRGEIGYKVIDGQRMPLFKVTVVTRAAGSSYSAAKGGDTMIALDYLERRGKTYVDNGESTQVQTTQDTPVYSSNVEDTSVDTAPVDTANCADCQRQAGIIPTDQMDTIAQLGTIAPSQEDTTDDDTNNVQNIPAPGQLQGFVARGKPLCNRFIDTDGSYGSYGRKAITEIRKHPAFATNTLPFTSVCRNYLDFSAEQREHFQVWVLASLSAHEASCSPTARNPGAPHGAALGLLQMEESVHVRAGRPHPYCDGGPHAMADANQNLSCGIAIMNNGLVAPNHSLFNPSTSNNYWRDLITPGETYDLINSYTACGNGITHYASRGGGGSRHHSRHSRHHRSRKQ